MRLMKRLVSLVLSLCFVFGVASEALATDADAPVIYGTLHALGTEDVLVEEYDAARKGPFVYLSAAGIARLVGGSFSQKGSTLVWTDGCRTLEVDPEHAAAHLYAAVGGNSRISLNKYGFELEECLYNEEEKQYYLPLDQMLYLLGCEWVCANGAVYVYQPETLLDIAAQSISMHDKNPDITDLMGDSSWENWGNSFKYGIAASLDEIDMTFLWDSAQASFGLKESLSYEDKVVQNALLLLRSDLPDNAQSDDYATIDNGLGLLSKYFNNIGSALGLSSTSGALQVISDLTGLKGSDLSDISQNLSSLADWSTLGTNAASYLLNVTNLYWSGSQLSQTFDLRMQRIAKLQNNGFGKDLDGLFTRLQSAATTLHDRYADTFSSAVKDSFNLDSIVAMVDAAFGIAGHRPSDLPFLSSLNLMSTLVGFYGLAVNAMKLVLPSFATMLEKGESAHVAKYLLNLSEIFYKEYKTAISSLNGKALTQQDLDEVRICGQICESAALHAMELLDVVKGTDSDSSGIYGPEVYLNRLMTSAQYDNLLLIDYQFSNLHSELPGARRDVIPPSYVSGLPLVDIPFMSGETVDVLPASEEIGPDGEPLAPNDDETEKEPPATLTAEGDDISISRITIRSKEFGEFSFEPDLSDGGGSAYGNLLAADMGDGTYTYVVSIAQMGTMGGSHIFVVRPVDGTLQVVAKFNLNERLNDVYFTGKFESDTQLSVTAYPTETTEILDYESVDGLERAGKEIWENGLGGMHFELNDYGFYDLVFVTYYRCLANMDVVGYGCTSYHLEDDSLELKEQWFEVNDN